MNLEYQEAPVPNAIPIYINSSLLKLANCRRRLALTMHGYDPEEDADSKDILLTGSALHKFAEEFTTNGGDIVEAVTAASKQYPSVKRSVIIACGAERTRIAIPPAYVLNGKPCVEFNFNLPWYTFTHDGKLYQLVLCGTIDHLAYDGRVIRIYDYKSSRKRMREAVLDKYRHSSQFAFYQWIVYEFGARLKLPIDMQNTARRADITSCVVPIMISTNPPQWLIGPARYLTTQQFEEFKQTLINTISVVLQAYFQELGANADGMINDSCQYCKFKSYCYAATPAEQNRTLASYPRKPYNPTAKYEDPD